MVWGTKKLRPSVCGAVGGKNWNLWPLGCLMVVQKCALPYFRTRCRGECGQLGNTEANFMELYVWLGLWIFTQELFDTKEQLCPLKYQIKLFVTLQLWITQDLEFRWIMCCWSKLAQMSHTCLVIQSQRLSDKEGGCHCPLGSFVITDDTHSKEYYNKVMFFIAWKCLFLTPSGVILLYQNFILTTH